MVRNTPKSAVKGDFNLSPKIDRMDIEHKNRQPEFKAERKEKD